VSEWDRIVAEHGPLVFGTAWRILGHAADAEDVTQDVFLQAYQTSQEQPIRSWPALLRRLAACRALDRLRLRKVAVPIHELALVCPGGGPEEEAIGRELSERLRDALTRLPRQEAAAFCLRYFEDLTYQQIADALHVTPGAVGNALFKARARLERWLLGTSEETSDEPARP
jgi:RNA polymerase sigma-70 factor (ECF subfamily)